MRLNLFASCIILAASRAIEIVNDFDALNNYAQVDASAEWRADGVVEKKYTRPEDNCCIVYYANEFKDPEPEPLCWPKGGDMKGKEKKYAKEIKGVDCGKHTWIDLLSHIEKSAGGGKHEQSLAGRISYDLIDVPNNMHLGHQTIRIGPYDD